MKKVLITIGLLSLAASIAYAADNVEDNPGVVCQPFPECVVFGPPPFKDGENDPEIEFPCQPFPRCMKYKD